MKNKYVLGIIILAFKNICSLYFVSSRSLDLVPVIISVGYFLIWNEIYFYPRDPRPLWSISHMIYDILNYKSNLWKGWNCHHIQVTPFDITSENKSKLSGSCVYFNYFFIFKLASLRLLSELAIWLTQITSTHHTLKNVLNKWKNFRHG